MDARESRTTNSPTARRRRVPYEWILGAAFVASFATWPWPNSFVARAAWLVVVGPLAGAALGARTRDQRPRFGLLLLTAVLGLLWCAALFLLVEAKTRYWESRDAIEDAIETLIPTWPIAALLGFTAQGLAAAKLVLAWIVDLTMSTREC
jgi:hypothetical protein